MSYDALNLAIIQSTFIHTFNKTFFDQSYSRGKSETPRGSTPPVLHLIGKITDQISGDAGIIP